jgi:hypothetical protein
MRKKTEDLHLEKRTSHRIPRFIDSTEVLSVSSRGWYIGPRKLRAEEVSALKAEAKDFERSFLWQTMRRDIHYLAYLQATAKAATQDDLIYAGAMYKDLEILESFIKQCKAL